MHRSSWAICSLALSISISYSVAWSQTRAPASPAEPVAARDKPGWSVDGRTGCRWWNSEAYAGEPVGWSGECGGDGRASGRGRAEWRLGERRVYYEGEWRDGRAHGRGVFVSANGDRYEGEFRDGNIHGRGVFVMAAGGRYEGEYREGKFDGRGTLAAVGGARYEGEWRNGRREGWGVWTAANGNRYEGEWRNDAPDGQGDALVRGSWHTGRWSGGCFLDGNRRIAYGGAVARCPHPLTPAGAGFP